MYAQAVDYDERGSHELTDLYRMMDGEGPFKGVRRLRDETCADIDGPIVDDPTGCGLSRRVAPIATPTPAIGHFPMGMGTSTAPSGDTWVMRKAVRDVCAYHNGQVPAHFL